MRSSVRSCLAASAGEEKETCIGAVGVNESLHISLAGCLTSGTINRGSVSVLLTFGRFMYNMCFFVVASESRGSGTLPSLLKISASSVRPSVRARWMRTGWMGFVVCTLSLSFKLTQSVHDKLEVYLYDLSGAPRGNRL